MHRRRSPALLACCTVAAIALSHAPTRADAPAVALPAVPAKPAASLFDPARHMRVAEVKAGQKGYVRTVVSGTKIDQFDVEVVSVLRNQFGPGRDVVLIRCKGDFMEHVGSVAGMSGSPVYLYDDAGKPRMIGAYAYGWDLQKDPLAGVQPIEYMAQLAPTPVPPNDAAGAATSAAPVPGPANAPRTRWSLLEAGVVPAFDAFAKGQPTIRSSIGWHSSRDGSTNAFEPRDADDASRPALRPLAIPLAASGLHPESYDLLRTLAGPTGLKPLMAAGSAPDAAAAQSVTPIEPGSVLVASLLTGDLEMTGLGTCTDVIGDRVIGFGHPMLGDGAASIPFAGGSVNVIVPMLTASFKVGAGTAIQGVLDRDSEVGIAGTIGSKARTFPVTVNVTPALGSPRTYNFTAAIHGQMTPMLAAVASFNCVNGPGELPEENTLHYDYVVRFANGRELKAAGQVPSSIGTPVDFARALMMPLAVAMENPFQRVEPTSVQVNLRVERGVSQVELEAIDADQSKYEPGDTVKLHLTLRRYHGGKETRDVAFALPADLAPGDYQVQALDADSNLRAEAAANPQKFAIENVDELFQAMQFATLTSGQPKLYLRLMRQPEGLSIGRTALQKLPASRRLVYGQLGRPDVQPVAESVVVEVPFDSYVVADGAAAIKVVKKK